MKEITGNLKRKNRHKQTVHSSEKLENPTRPPSFISMVEARKIAEHLFSGIAWIG